MGYPKQFMENNSTNHPIEYNKQKRFIDRIATNLFLTIIDVDEKLVSYLSSGFNSGARGKILEYIDKNPVFLVPTMINVTGVEWSHAYKIISKLKVLKCVITTTDNRYKIKPSSRRYAGERPRIHHLSHIELTGPSDPRVRSAQIRYFEMIKTQDYEEPIQTSLDSDIVQELIAFFHSNKRYAQFTPTPMEIMDYLRTSYGKVVDPQNRKDHAKKVSDRLRKMKLGDEL